MIRRSFVSLIVPILVGGTALLGIAQGEADKLREDRWLCVPARNPDMTYILQADSDFVTLGVPFRTNEYGFRDRPVLEKTDPIYRILCLGDSVTFGTGVSNEKTFPNVLEATLQRYAGERSIVDVINAGISAYNVRNIRGLLKETIEPLQPDLVVYVFVENDLDDSVSVGPGGFLMALDPVKEPEEPFIGDDFPGVWLIRRDEGKKKGFFRKIVSFFDNRLNVVSEAPPPLLFGPHPTAKQRWAFFESELSKMKEECDSHGAPLAVYSFGLKNHSEPVVRKVRTVCKRLGIPDASTLPIFDQRTYMKKHSLGYDPHCNPEGHRLMADRLLSFLSSGGLLDPVLQVPRRQDAYAETLDDSVADRLEHKAMEAPHTIDLVKGKGALGLLGGVDPDGYMARYALMRLAGPGDRIVIEAVALFSSPGQEQTLSAEIEGVSVGKPVLIERNRTQAVFAIPTRYEEQTVEVKLIAHGPIDIPSPEERVRGKTPRTIRLMKVERASG